MENISKSDIIIYLKRYYVKNKKSPVMTDPIHPFKFYHIKKYFKTWNLALTAANLPLNRTKIILTKCKLCNRSFNKQMKEIIKSNNDFCSHKCAAIFNNTGRKMSDETKEKIRKKLQLVRFTNCIICKIKFRYYKRKNKTCSEKCLSDLRKLNNRKREELRFKLLN